MKSNESHLLVAEMRYVDGDISRFDLGRDACERDSGERIIELVRTLCSLSTGEGAPSHSWWVLDITFVSIPHNNNSLPIKICTQNLPSSKQASHASFPINLLPPWSCRQEVSVAPAPIWSSTENFQMRNQTNSHLRMHSAIFHIQAEKLSDRPVDIAYFRKSPAFNNIPFPSAHQIFSKLKGVFDRFDAPSCFHSGSFQCFYTLSHSRKVYHLFCQALPGHCLTKIHHLEMAHSDPKSLHASLFSTTSRRAVNPPNSQILLRKHSHGFRRGVLASWRRGICRLTVNWPVVTGRRGRVVHCTYVRIAKGTWKLGNAPEHFLDWTRSLGGTLKGFVSEGESQRDILGDLIWGRPLQPTSWHGRCLKESPELCTGLAL